MKRVTVLVCAAAALLALTACSSGTGGFPTASTTSGTTTSDNSGGSGGSTSTGSSGGKIGSADQLSNTQACSLLTASETAQLGLPSTPDNNVASGAKSGCQWIGNDFTVIVSIRTDVGLSGVVANGGTPVQTTVGSHQAVKLAEDGSLGCLYAIGITASMRVDVQSVPISTGDPCQESLAAAQIVEPKLP